MMKRGSRRGKNLALFLIVLTTLTIALSGCAGDKAEDSSKITIGIPQDIDSLDPHKAQGAGTREVLFNVYEGLVKPDENGNLNPAVASNRPRRLCLDTGPALPAGGNKTQKWDR